MCPNNAIRRFALAMLLFTHCCISLAGPATLDKYSGLASAIDRYYQAEKSKDWNTAYGMRGSKFRKDVPLNLYVREQSKADKGWRLVKWTIESAREQRGYVVVEMKFTEIAPKEFLNTPKEMTLDSDEKSVWISESGQWYCVECAVRGRLPLNVSTRDWKNGD